MLFGMSPLRAALSSYCSSVISFSLSGRCWGMYEEDKLFLSLKMFVSERMLKGSGCETFLSNMSNEGDGFHGI